MRDIKTRAPPECDIVLCGNKCDLDNDRVVQYEEGKQLADEYGVQFFETSALTGHHVEQMFTALATTIKRKRIDEFENMATSNGGISNAPSSDNPSGTDGTINLAAAAAASDTAKRSGTKGSTCCQWQGKNETAGPPVFDCADFIWLLVVFMFPYTLTYFLTKRKN
jgi:Ras family